MIRNESIAGAAEDQDRKIGQVEEFLKATLAEMPEVTTPEGPGRPRVLPALALWTGLLLCVLRGFGTQSALWRLLSEYGLWYYPRFEVTDEAVYKRLERGGTKPLQELFATISAIIRQRLSPLNNLAPFAAEVVALDETTLDPVARTLPAIRSLKKGDWALLPGKLAALFDIRRQQWLRVEHIPDPCQNEKVAAREMVEGLPKGSLIIADLGYFSFPWFDHLSEKGYYWLSRFRERTSYEILHRFYEQGETLDALIFLGAYRADKTAYAVRLVQFKVGKTLYRYITNVKDPRVFPLGDMARLYARRWDIEMAFKLIKQHLGLHLLWSAKQTVVLQQVWAVLIIAQILMALRFEIAEKAEVDPFDVSLELLIKQLPQAAMHGGFDPIQRIVEEGHRYGYIRPSRRIRTQAPEVPPDEITLPPPELQLYRKPRYAGKEHRR